MHKYSSERSERREAALAKLALMVEHSIIYWINLQSIESYVKWRRNAWKTMGELTYEWPKKSSSKSTSSFFDERLRWRGYEITNSLLFSYIPCGIVVQMEKFWIILNEKAFGGRYPSQI